MDGFSEVDDWFMKLYHPQKETMQAIRLAIKSADSRMTECMKWKTPTFVYKGDFASLQSNARKFASLMFHRGAQIPGEHPYLEGDARLVRTMKFRDVQDVEGKQSAIEAIVKSWCDWRDNGGRI